MCKMWVNTSKVFNSCGFHIKIRYIYREIYLGFLPFASVLFPSQDMQEAFAPFFIKIENENQNKFSSELKLIIISVMTSHLPCPHYCTESRWVVKGFVFLPPFLFPLSHCLNSIYCCHPVKIKRLLIDQVWSICLYIWKVSF